MASRIRQSAVVISTVLMTILLCMSINVSSLTNGITFLHDSYEMSAGNPLTVYVDENSADVARWSVSDNTVAYISSSNTRSATIEGLKEGTINLIATDEDNKDYNCEIHVSVPQIELSHSTFTMGLNIKNKLTIKSGDRAYWKSSNNDIVSLEMDGRAYSRNNANANRSDITLVGKGLGKATVTATTSYGATATCEVTVKESYLELSAYEVSFSDNGNAGKRGIP